MMSIFLFKFRLGERKQTTFQQRHTSCTTREPKYTTIRRQAFVLKPYLDAWACSIVSLLYNLSGKYGSSCTALIQLSLEICKSVRRLALLNQSNSQSQSLDSVHLCYCLTLVQKMTLAWFHLKKHRYLNKPSRQRTKSLSSLTAHI